MQTASETFRLSAAAAERYESQFVPALFAEWAPRLTELAGVAPGQAVLDVACGTGIVARTVADAQRGHGRVVGLDLNEAMLGVARRVRPEIEWRQGDAAHLPFPDGSFDVALCQMAFMFFPERTRVLREMARVVTAAGVVAFSVPSRLESQPAYAPFVELAARHAGPEAIRLLGTYFASGDLEELRRLVEEGGLQIAATRTHLGRVRCPSIDAFVANEVESTPLRERISDEVYARIREGARELLRPYTQPGGAAEIPLEGHVIAARKRV
ncbi:MAG TPA: methyltransferase domain-containing protein [Methylomirabilota bacterium]|nr:methyltransferase domain-containing protein [Methylomirabilota bacterium]